MKNYLLVGLGAALGAMSRLAMTHVIPAALYAIPIQILLINTLGCFLIGALTSLLEFIYASSSIRLLIFTGFLGGFTTFSSFALEFGLLTEKNAIGNAIIYVTLSVGLGLSAFFIGLKLIRFLFH